jgi:hypothetical protein
MRSAMTAARGFVQGKMLGDAEEPGRERRLGWVVASEIFIGT